MEMAILKEREKTGEELIQKDFFKKTVELDFKLYETKTIKVNLQIMYFLERNWLNNFTYFFTFVHPGIQINYHKN